MNRNPNFMAGALLGAAMMDCPPGELRGRLARQKVMSSEEAVPFNRELCKIAAAAFEQDGRGNGVHAVLFRNLATVDKWERGYDLITDCVKRALSKQAAPAAAVALHNNLGGGALKTLIAMGALGGGAAGSLAFLLSRNASQTSAENEALLEKIREYKRLRRDIEEDMASEGLLSASSNA